jgi:hypothetical protein
VSDHPGAENAKAATTHIRGLRRDPSGWDHRIERHAAGGPQVTAPSRPAPEVGPDDALHWAAAQTDVAGR